MILELPLVAQVIQDTLTLQFHRIDSKDGLSQGMVTGIVQDPEGFMWFSTRDGLNRYDGYSMKTFRHNPKDPFSLPNNQICGLEFDQNGNFWIATTTHGLWRMDRKTERFYLFGPPDQLVWGLGAMYLSKNWLIVIGRKHFKVFDTHFVSSHYIELPDSTKAYFQRSYFYQGEVDVIDHYPDVLPDGRAFTYGFNDELCIWKKTLQGVEQKCLPTNKADKQRHATNRYSVDTALQQIWVFHEKEVLCRSLKDGRVIHRVQWPGGIQSTEVYCSKMVHHKILVQTLPSAHFWEFNTKTLEFTFIQSNFSKSASLHRHYIDRLGNQWFGTGGEGLAVLPANGRRFRTKFPGRFIYSLVVTPNQEVVFEDRKIGGICWFSPKTGALNYEKIKYEIPGIEAVAPALFNYKMGTTWKFQFVYGNHVALKKVSPNGKADKLVILPRVENITFNMPLLFIDSVENLWRIEADRSGKWYLRCIDLNKIAIPKTYQFPLGNLSHILPFVSKHWVIGNHLWLGTTQGLFAFDLQKRLWLKHFRHIPEKPASLSENTILSLCPDPIEPRQYMWIGTIGGLNKMDLKTGHCTIYSEQDGLPNNVIYGILSDEFHNLWLSTNKGLCCFTPPKTEKERPVCRNFTTEDGLANDEFNRYSYTKMANGDLVFGGTNGLTWFSPKEVLKTGKPPQMAITGFSIFNTPVDFRSDSTVVQAPFPFARQVNLNHKQDMFRVEFASLDFGPNTQKKYSYFLEGYDQTWIPGGISNSATYTNLSPGEYTFRVKGTNADGIWSTEEATLRICISPPWWGTWWFQTLAVFSILGLIFGAYRYQLNQAIRVLKLRNRIALDLHDEIGSTLNSIAFFGQVANQMMAEDNQAKPVLDRMSMYAKEVVESMSDIVWSLNTKNDSFENLVDRLQSFASQMLEPKGCTVEFQRPEGIGEIKLDMEQRRNLYLILKEAINNAAKYAEATKLWVNFNHYNHELQVEVGDNGKGFNPQTVANGNGLDSMEGRANSMGAKWRIESIPERGTQLFLSIKI